MNQNELLIDPTASRNESVRIAHEDAQIALYSLASGAQSGAIAFKELNESGMLNNQWSITRNTGASALDFRFGTDNNFGVDPSLLHIASNGNVGIGTTSPTHPLEMASGAHVTSGGVWTDASSRTLKENIHDLSTEDAMSALEQLKPKMYNYIVDKDERYLGFIAEEVPELVAMSNRKSLSPMDIVAVLTKEVQQQQAQIEELKTLMNMQN